MAAAWLALLALGLGAPPPAPRRAPADARAGETRPALLHRARFRHLLALRGGDADERLAEPAQKTKGAAAPLRSAEPPVGCWSVIDKLISMVRMLLTPKYDYAKKDNDILGSTQQLSGFAPDDESWRTQRKKLHDIELGPATRKRVMRDLRRLKQVLAGR